MANIREAFEYAAQNPDSDFANNLKSLAASGSLDAEAQKYNIDLTPFKPKSSVMQELGSNLMGRGRTILGEVTAKPARDLMGEGASGAEVALRTAQAPIRAVGAVGGAIGDVFGAGLQATGLDQPIAQAMQPIAESGVVQDAMSYYNSLPQDTQDVLASIANSMNIPIARLAGTVAKSGAQTAAEGAMQGAGGIVDSVEGAFKGVNKAMTPLPEEAVANTYKGIMDLVENKQTLLRDFTKREGTGKDPVRIIAENPDYMVKINPEAKTIDATDALANMERDIAEYSNVRDTLLRTADEMFPLPKTNDIILAVSDKISSKNYKKYLDEGETAVKDVINKMASLKKFYPDTISREELNGIRKSLDETINNITNTKLKDKLRLDMRTVFKETLEQSIPEKGLLEKLNAQIGDIIDASEFTSKKLNGTKVKGGGLTDLAMKTTGTAIGATGLGGVMGGIPGMAAGYFLSDLISKTLIKNAINNPFDRAVLEKLKQVKPDIINKAEDFISQRASQARRTEEPKKLFQSYDDIVSQPQKNVNVKGGDNLTPEEVNTQKIREQFGDITPEMRDESFKKTNIFVSEERYQQAKKSLAEKQKKQGGQMKSSMLLGGEDFLAQSPELITIASYHIGNGIKTAAELAKVLAEEGYNLTKEQLDKVMKRSLDEIKIQKIKDKPVKLVAYQNADKVPATKYERAGELTDLEKADIIDTAIDQKDVATMKKILKEYGILLESDAEKVKALKYIRELVKY